MLRGSLERKIFAYRKPVDMRKSFNGLIDLTSRVLSRDPLSGHIYVFTNRSGSIMKCLFWDRTGYVVVSKRLERGKFKVPTDGELTELENRTFWLVFDGLSLVASSR